MLFQKPMPDLPTLTDGAREGLIIVYHAFENLMSRINLILVVILYFVIVLEQIEDLLKVSH